ncbi:hypothetical protein [Curtobacterium sp. ISL-83]|uniref:hypothetical protein n=1 Tax=Curtobacterium sp. ISL-83 TaxID=2819145 RepID=UPI001BEC68E7|nr:hypothetical protein [Curtobacterium sp. ISL-83]MBT2502654.1 hypothetical protein [Curtobacterium sp. ISL-83]
MHITTRTTSHTATRTTTRTRAVLVTAILAAVLPLSLASCSSDSSGTTAAEAVSGVGTRWGACMRDAGFDVQDPSDEIVERGAYSRPEGVDAAGFDTAAAGCSEQLGIEGSSSAQKQQWARQYDQVASCVREHGYEDYPEQQPGALDFNPSNYPRAAEPGFEKVTAECLQEFAPDTIMQGGN